MGVRPPANDDDDGPEVIEFGIAALDARLSDADVTYPADAQSLRDELGHVEVPYDASGHAMTLADALEEIDRREFEHEQDLLNALHPVFESRREATGNSLLAQLRSLIPF
ncbi:hypothetical protein SAMN05216559_3064 [Halomicrobium zhouii]|uniref:Uncharacterized protein n=1 Tax=Halomicrobium zhouii TaxID=767519 RepID=A0A1I6LT57_9EURY|nr:hypothetical protein [Halomicrobium zhouii]SFS06596.1 hypothetical protein SAMN05216559_3064 [Halomicrobium zhouii]